jgi:hypothetical protein
VKGAADTDEIFSELVTPFRKYELLSRGEKLLGLLVFRLWLTDKSAA